MSIRQSFKDSAKGPAQTRGRRIVARQDADGSIRTNTIMFGGNFPKASAQTLSLATKSDFGL